MSTITRELAKLFRKITNSEIDAEGNAHVVLSPADSLLINNARIALASLEAEPVAWLLSGGGAKNNVSFDSGNAYADPLRDVTPLYTAPPAPVSVPAAMEMDDDFDSAFEHGKAVGWNAYRAAMLQGAYGNTPVIPDGWQLVPKKITLEMECALSRADSYEIGWRWALAAAPTHSGTNDGWVACSERMPGMGVDVLACTISPIGGFEEIETAQWHGGMKGEQPVFITSADAIEPTHWMPLPAAPQQEVTQALAKGMERYGDAMQKLADSDD